MNKIKQLLMLLIVLKTGFVYSQNSFKTNTRQFTWVYDLPSSYPRGPLDITVKGEYYFTKERLGDRYFVRLHCRVVSLEYNPVHGTLRYKYNGKEYKQDQLNATDKKGYFGFDQIRITKIAANIDVSFLENSKTVSIGDGIAKDVGDIDKDADLNKLDLELAGSRLTYLNWDGSIDLEQRIQNLNKTKINSKNNNSNNSSNSSNNSTSNNSGSKGTFDYNKKSFTNSQTTTNSSSASSNTTNTNTSGNIVNNNSSSTNTTHNAAIQNNQTYTIPSAESQMIKLGIDPNKDYLGELITMGGTLLKEINENRRLRWEKEAKEAERLERLKAENTAKNTNKYVNYFKNYFVDKYFSAAKAGDDTARLMLIMKCKELSDECSAQPNSNYCDYENFLKAIPIYESAPSKDFAHFYWITHWESEMIKNNNLDAINLKGCIIDKSNSEALLPLLEKGAAMGSLDAMLRLGMYYNSNEKLSGGNNEEKALYWFTKAANGGCPMAAYYLGMIYRYGHTIRPENYSKKTSLYLAYSVKKNDKIAAEWFAKSINYSKNHKESVYAKHQLILSRISWTTVLSMEYTYYGLAVSISNPDAYIQLSKMYSKGIGVAKNIELAEQLKLEGEALYNFYKNLR